MISKKVFITLGLSCLLLFGCQTASKIGPESSVLTSASYDSGFALFEAEETKKEESAEYLDYVTAGIKLWTSESLELKLTNVSHETIRYGEAFAIEVLHNGVWEKLPVLLENYGFNDISYELKPGEYRFIDIDFAWLYGELHEGWFRIIKEIYLQDGTIYSVPAEFGDLDFRQTEIVKEFGNPKEVLDEMSITSNVIVTNSNEDELQIKFELENVGVCTFVASKGKNLSLPNETFIDSTKIKWTALTADDEYIFPYMKVNEAGDMFMIDWTYKEYHFAIYGKSPERTSDRDMAGKIALEMIRNLGADTTNIPISNGG